MTNEDTPHYTMITEDGQLKRVPSEAPVCSAYGIFEETPKYTMSLEQSLYFKLDGILNYIKVLEKRIEKLEQQGNKQFEERIAMSWNYRIIEKEFSEYPDEKDYSIHEVYYDQDGNIQSITVRPVPISGNTPEEVRAILEMMKEALDKPILKMKELEEKWKNK